MALRIIFMGTPDFSVPTLKALHAAGHEIVACYSQPPRPAGRRGLELTPSPVHKTAQDLGIPVLTPPSLKDDEALRVFSSHEADIAVVVAYGLLLPQTILDCPKHGCFNGHASLLPRWRGAAPIQRAIMAGDDETGMMIMRMEAGLDTGPVALEHRLPILPDMTAGDLHDRLAEEGAALMVAAMQKLESGGLPLTPQSDEGVTYASKITKEECRIDWSKSAQDVRNHIMGLAPFPGAWCEMDLGGKQHRVKVLRAEKVEGTTLSVESDGLVVPCGNGAVKLTRLQRAGSKAMDAEEFFRGNALTSDQVLS